MNDLTPPTGGNLLHTSEPNPGDRISAALRSLEHTPPPGWLWALWVSCLPGLRHDPLAGPMPEGVAIVNVGEREGFDLTPPHYGIAPRETLPVVDGATGPECLAGVLVSMLRHGEDAPGCVCAECIPTGIPPEMAAYFSAEAFCGWDLEPRGWRPTDADPFAGIRHTIALEVASAHAERDLYTYALITGKAPAGWHAEALDGRRRGHYLARMSDTGLAVGVCSAMWYSEMLETGMPALLPVEIVAALAVGFTYPLPMPDSSEWAAQAKAEELTHTFPLCPLLRHAAHRIEDSISNGVVPWGPPAKVGA